ncbi:MAG: GDSL-type esterase/lipase family protein [Pseudonocardiales bacterium]
MSMNTSRRRWLAGSVVAAAVALLAVVVPAAAARPSNSSHSARHDSGYLALGDSVAFGFRPGALTPTSAYLHANNFGGYAEALSGIDALSLANASCPGETSGSMVTPGAQSNGCENSLGSPVGYRTNFPLHVAYSGTQLAYAVDYLRHQPRTGLITISIGANDLFVCQRTTSDHCTGADFAATVQQISANLTTIFRALRHDAHYRGRLVTLAYYSISYTDPVQVAGTQALNTALTAVTRHFDGVVADGFAAFQRASQSTGGDPCAAGLLLTLPGGTCDVHPSPYGHALLAGAIQQVIGQDD